MDDLTTGLKDLKKLTTIGRFIGTHPWNYNNSKTTLIYVLFIVVSYLVTDTATIYDIIVGQEIGTYVDKVIFFCFRTIQLVFFFGYMRGTVSNRKSWKVLLQTLREINNNLNISTAFNNNYFNLKLVLFNLLLIPNQLVLFIYVYNKNGNIFPIIVEGLVFYQVFWTMLVMKHLMDLLAIRYYCVQQVLNEIFSKNESFISTKKIGNLKQIIFKLNCCYRQINIIFGLPITVIIISTFVNVLCIFDVVLLNEEKKKDLDFYDLMQYFRSMTATIFTIQLISGCENAEQKYSNLINSYHLLQSKITDTVLREEVIILTNYVKSMQPTFKAKGLFLVNKQLLSTFLSGLVTYLFIIIQFKAVK